MVTNDCGLHEREQTQWLIPSLRYCHWVFWFWTGGLTGGGVALLYVLQLQFLISRVLRFSSMFFCCFYVLQRSHMYSYVHTFLHFSCIASSYILLFTSTFLIICSSLMFPHFFPGMKTRSSVVYHLLRVFIFSQTSSHLSCFHTIPSVNRPARLLSAATSPLLFPQHCHPLPPSPPPLSPVSPPSDFFLSLSCSSPSSPPAAAAVSHPLFVFHLPFPSAQHVTLLLEDKRRRREDGDVCVSISIRFIQVLSHEIIEKECFRERDSHLFSSADAQNKARGRKRSAYCQDYRSAEPLSRQLRYSELNNNANE